MMRDDLLIGYNSLLYKHAVSCVATGHTLQDKVGTDRCHRKHTVGVQLHMELPAFRKTQVLAIHQVVMRLTFQSRIFDSWRM
jgi:tRNA(Ile)-lysidine synthase TilS/MesJ